MPSHQYADFAPGKVVTHAANLASKISEVRISACAIDSQVDITKTISSGWMKVHNFLVIIFLLCTLLVSVGRSESKEFEQINSKNLKSTLKRNTIQISGPDRLFNLREIKSGKEISSVLGNKLVGPASVPKN